MKHFFKISIIALAFICVFCQNADAHKKRVTNSNNTSAAGKITNITVSQYKQLVSDYEHSPFIFKGKRPAVVYSDGIDNYMFEEENTRLEELAKKYKGRVDFYSIDSPWQMNDLYDFIGVPAIILFTNSNTFKDNIMCDNRFVEHSLDLEGDGAMPNDRIIIGLYVFSNGKFFKFDENMRDNDYDTTAIIDDLLKTIN